MKRIRTIAIAAAIMVGLLTGCSNDNYVKLTDIDYEKYVTLGEYKNMSVTVDTVGEVTEEEVLTEAINIYQYYATEKNGGIKDRAVITGDMVVMDYVGKKDGVAFEGGSATGVGLVIGSGEFLEGFEDGLIGVNPGETVELNLTFPSDYENKQLAGAKVVFTVTIHYIIPAEMKDEVINNFGYSEFNSVESLKQYIRTKLEEQEAGLQNAEVEKAIFEKLFKASAYKELPDNMVKQYKEVLKGHLEANAAYYGTDASTLIYMYYGKELEEYLDEQVDTYLKYMLTTVAIAKQENLIPTDAEMDQRLHQLATENGYKSVEEMVQFGFVRESLEEQLISDDVVEWLLKNVTIVTK